MNQKDADNFRTMATFGEGGEKGTGSWRSTKGGFFLIFDVFIF